mmetsp:Transcript_34434/g.51347  ORF Transcript_34434/g.51347 Transcript_34434/m.51347 type:complete len:85 (+) Transcript_34434:68-322(+)
MLLMKKRRTSKVRVLANIFQFTCPSASDSANDIRVPAVLIAEVVFHRSHMVHDKLEASGLIQGPNLHSLFRRESAWIVHTAIFT